MSRTRGIPEVPLLQTRKIVDKNGQVHEVLAGSGELRRWMVDMREIVKQLQGVQAPVIVPTNLKVTAEPFGNLVQWTRSANADFFEVLWNTTPNLAGAVIVSVGNSAQWTDNIGQVGIKRFYWVRGAKLSGARSLEAGPLSGTSLASNAGVAPPTPPPAGQNQVFDQRTRIVQPWKIGNNQ